MSPDELEILARLNLLEQRDLASTADSDALHLMLEFARSPEHLGVLVERYGPSGSTHIASRLAGCITQKQFEDGFEDSLLPLLMLFLRDIRPPEDHPETLATALSAINLEMRKTEIPKVDFSPLVNVLFDCLSGRPRIRGADDLFISAIEVLHTLVLRKELDTVLPQDRQPEVIDSLSFAIQWLQSHGGSIYDPWLEEARDIIEYVRAQAAADK